MTQKEFFDRTGIELTEDQYKQVEQMYLEAGNMDKDEFCKDYKKHHESTLLATYFRQAENLKNKLDDMRDESSWREHSALVILSCLTKLLSW